MGKLNKYTSGEKKKKKKKKKKLAHEIVGVDSEKSEVCMVG